MTPWTAACRSFSKRPPRNPLDFPRRRASTSSIDRQPTVVFLALAIFCLTSGRSALSQVLTNQPLTNAHSIISLPAETAARSLPVKVAGVVTAADPTLKGRFFVQDASGGVFVDNANGRRPDPGDVVAVEGITYPGAYAPTITAPRVRVAGHAPLPAAKPVSVDQLMSGAEDSQRVEITGVVRDARLDGSRLALDLVTGGYRYVAYVTVPTGFRPERLSGAEVLVRGTAAEAHNRSLRQLIQIELYIPGFDDLVVRKPEAVDPFERPALQLARLAQYESGNSLAQRVHVRGVVLLQKPGECVYLQDESGALPVESRQPIQFAPGQEVEAVGFVGFENYLPVLQDASFRPTSRAPAALHPKPVAIEQLQNGLFRADYISLTGRLIERTAIRGRHASAASAPSALVLQSTNFTFTATSADAQGPLDLASIPIGSLLQISGVCLTEIDADGKLKSFEILLSDAGGVRILQQPSWLTASRLLIGLGVLSSILIVIISWSVMLSRQVRQRTDQLKFEITARKESEVRFKAVLSERTRLAQELHDTVEQTLTGIAFQLDTAAKLRERQPDASQRHAELARALMSRSQAEVRQSVWDLRSRALEQFDLASALGESARQSANGSGIQVHVVAHGQPRHLSEVVEENLLRIGQEACANAVKHARANQIHIELQFLENKVILRVRDDGCGFDPATAPGPRQNHFGILGMSERVKRLGGRLAVHSAPGKGATVTVEVPLRSPDEEPPVSNDPSATHEKSRETPHSDC